jgi:hypothetical protein
MSRGRRERRLAARDRKESMPACHQSAARRRSRFARGDAGRVRRSTYSLRVPRPALSPLRMIPSVTPPWAGPALVGVRSGDACDPNVPEYELSDSPELAPRVRTAGTALHRNRRFTARIHAVIPVPPLESHGLQGVDRCSVVRPRESPRFVDNPVSLRELLRWNDACCRAAARCVPTTPRTSPNETRFFHDSGPQRARLHGSDGGGIATRYNAAARDHR